MAKAEKTTKKVLDAMGNPVGDESLLAKMFSGLYNSEGAAEYLKGLNPDVAKAYSAASANPLSFKGQSVKLGDGVHEFSNAGVTGKLMGDWIKNNKLKSAGLGATGLMNIGGLFDDDQLVGQLAGLGGGFAAGKLLLPKVLGKGPLTGSGMALATMTGGALGSLFDKLMAKKKEEETMQQAQYAQNGVY